MNADEIFEILKSHHEETGEIMDGIDFLKRVEGSTVNAITTGVNLFDEYLDEQREEQHEFKRSGVSVSRRAL